MTLYNKLSNFPAIFLPETRDTLLQSVSCILISTRNGCCPNHESEKTVLKA